ncbi:N-alpha-acetyltransferase 40-like isoform X1 [Gossypium australe]|uniref:N-alpha-acetyltransferase 40-like isoform X1 n=1 Tax=Gossypium australe TaxID=47621 RepID=A0A5B6VWT6_9ROSI|nr:N-alpha-acetyltransferase 40-like isoform X1 [Gossypium australe]
MESSRASEKKKLKRKEILEKKKAADQLLKAASAQIDHLTSFPSFCYFNKNGLCLRLESGRGDKISNCTKQHIQKLLKANMMEPYGSEWAVEEKVKRREMVAPEARYIFVYCNANEMMDNAFTPLLGFLHFRFTLEEEIPVLYLYELQLDSLVQGKGLGKFLMQLVELIAQEVSILLFFLMSLEFIVCTILIVFKSDGCCGVNCSKIKLISHEVLYKQAKVSSSLSKVGVEKNYEILCKTFDHEAKAILEVYSVQYRTARRVGFMAAFSDLKFED